MLLCVEEKFREMFITFEGIDGCGKSLQAEAIAKRFWEYRGTDGIVCTREPGGWPGGGALRQILLNDELHHSWSELFIFMADRCEHVAQVIVPALKTGRVVLCERYHDSTVAYQGWGRGLPRPLLDELFRWTELPKPDYSIFLDIPVEVALTRLRKRGSLDRFERLGSDFFARVREGFLAFADADPKRWIRVDGSAIPERVTEDILAQLCLRDPEIWGLKEDGA